MVAERRREVVAVRRATVDGVVVPAAAAIYTVRARTRTRFFSNSVFRLLRALHDLAMTILL